MSEQKPIEVAVIGGGCAGITAAFELTRPEHKGKYHVTVYQLGWRLGGKGASGRGPADRIEEHGLHVWEGFYENAFRLLRECYAELKRDPHKCRFADWRDAFFPEPFVGATEQRQDGTWKNWMVYFPPSPGLPGDPLTEQNPFSIESYLARTTALLRTLLLVAQNRRTDATSEQENNCHFSTSSQAYNTNPSGIPSSSEVMANVTRLIKYGLLATAAGVIEGVNLLGIIFRALPLYPSEMILRLLDSLSETVRRQLETFIEHDDEMRQIWEVVDLVLAFLRGAVRFNLLSDPRGFDAINDYECREWLRLNGASEQSLYSAFMRSMYDLVFGYEDGDFEKPRFAAGQGMRGMLRMFFTYRGSLFWKMRAGMGDVVFAPFYEALRRRGVTFRFFHRLENVKLVDPTKLAPGEHAYVEALEFDIQAETKDGAEYQPLVDVRGLTCWPSKPHYDQLINGDYYAREEQDFESHWERRKVSTKTLRVIDDFDYVILAVGIGAIPYVCKEIVERDSRWQAMVTHVKTIATQAFQLWLSDDYETLGWAHPQMCIAGFVHPFDTWADMRHLISEENWSRKPRAIAYFCSAFPEPQNIQPTNSNYLSACREEVKQNAIHFLRKNIRHLWPNAVKSSGEFRWELLVDTVDQTSSHFVRTLDESCFDSQFWTANVNPSDRYVLSLPGSWKYRISPLDNTYDNLTIAGDWTECGLNTGCVEAAVISGRLAAHALSKFPALQDIVGYDHP